MLTRSHFAHYLVEQSIVKPCRNAFDRYLSRGARAYVPIIGPALKKLLQLFMRHYGVAVLAHPGRYKLSTSG